MKSIHLALALALLAVVLAFLHGPVSGPLVDSGHFGGIAKTLVETGEYAVNGKASGFYPAYPAFLAASMTLFGPLWQNAAVAVVSGVLILSAFLLFSSALGEKKALWTFPIFAVTPLAVNASLQLLTDGLFLSLVLLSAWAYLEALKRPDAKWAAALVIFLGLSVLTRISGLLLVGIFAAHLVWQVRWAGKKFKWKPVAFALLFASLVFAGWAVRNHVSGIGDATSGYAGTLATPIQAAVQVDSSGGKTVLLLEEYRVLNGTKNAVNGPLALSLPVDLGIHAAWQWPLALNYAVRAALFLFLLAGVAMVAVVLTQAARGLKAKGTLEKLKRMDAGPALLLAWFVGFAAFHLLAPAALPSRYLLPLAVPLAAWFVSGVSRMDKTWMAALLLAQLAFSAAVLSWDSQNRWQSDADAAFVFAQTGAWIDASVPTKATVRVLGVPEDTAYFYSGRIARADSGSVWMTSNYGGENGPPQGLSQCAVFEKGRWNASAWMEACP